MANINVTMIGVPLSSGSIIPTNDFTNRLPVGNFSSDVYVPLQKMYPQSDSITAAGSHHRCAYPGMRWECPVRAMGGANPRFFEIVTGPVGLTIGGFLVDDGNGNLIAGRDYGLLKWETPVIGTHPIVIRCTDQNGSYVAFRWNLICATGLHLFAAPAALGDGSGSSPANARASDSVFVGGSIAANGKVVVVMDGEHPSTNAMMVGLGATSVIGYPGSAPIWKNKIYLEANDALVAFLTISEAGTSDFGIVSSYSNIHRMSSFYNTFIGCYSIDPQVTNNQCIHGLSATGGGYRKNVVICNNKYIDCVQLGAFDAYACESLLSHNEEYIANNLTLLQPQFIWFPKARCTSVEISFNIYDNPTLPGYTRVILPYNGIDGSGGMSNTPNRNAHIEYNYVNANYEKMGVDSNGADNNPAGITPYLLMSNYIRRNTFIGVGVSANNYDTDHGINRRTFIDNNIITVPVPVKSDVGPILATDWYHTDNNVSGSAIDSNGLPVDTTLIGKVGSVIRR